LGQRREEPLEDDGEHHEVLGDLRQRRRAVVAADAHQALRVQRERDEQGEAHHVVEVPDRERAADGVGLQVKAVEGVHQHGGDAHRVGRVAEGAGVGHG